MIKFFRHIRIRNKLAISQKILIYQSALFFVIFSCAEKGKSEPELTLDSKYQQIKSISTFANCIGPEGDYTTEVKSSADGNLLFTQVVADSNETFSVKITSDLKGYVIDDLETVIDTLPIEAVEMIRSHDFHRLHINPSHFFDSITYNSNIDKNTSLYHAKDRLNNPVNIFYNGKDQHIKKIELLNPIDTTQIIEIVNKKWTNSNYGKMVKEIEIIQAKKDTFYFKFDTIKINQY